MTTTCPPPCPPLLEVNGLSLRTASGAVILENLSLAVRPAQVVALVGESGSGKTMFARSILQLLPPQVQVSAGRIHFDGRDLRTLPAAEMRRLRGASIGMTFQDPAMSLTPTMRVGDQICEGLDPPLTARQRRGLLVDMLERVGIPDPEGASKAYPHHFSEGGRQRIMLASVMVRRPRLLIADEPTSSLDSLTQRQIMKLLMELRERSGTAILLITHDLGLVARYADAMAVLQRGRLVESGPVQKVLDAPQDSYTKALIQAAPRRGGVRPTLGPSTPLIEGQAVHVTFRQGEWPARRTLKNAVDGVSLRVHREETVALVGGSGSGKTTLGRALVGLQSPSGGVIRFRGVAVGGASTVQLRDYRLACQFIYQDPYSSLDPRQRVGEIVAEPMRSTPASPADKRRRTSQILEEVALNGLQMRYPHELSAGQRQRVAIARALVRDPEFIVADEPLSNLDMMTQRQLLELLKSLQSRHAFACLFITHSLATASELADRVLVMHQGRVVEEGSVDAVFDSPASDYTKRLVEASTFPSLTSANASQPTPK